MKKYFYLAAVSAMMLTACSSDNDVVQPKQEPTTPQVAVQQQAVAFDTYLSGTTASTRAGDAGIQTNATLKAANKGFGVFANYSNDAGYTTGSSINPSNFMYNQQVKYSADGGWTYEPLKYWPNETGNDSQADPATSSATDYLSFFAYAPYVSSASGTTGITDMIANNATNSDPWVTYKVASKPSESVDLLWGVAPTGNLIYTDVASNGVNKVAGMPLFDLTKPSKDQKIKFLFQHALARIGMTVVAAIDQISAGGELSATTKIAVKSVVITETTNDGATPTPALTPYLRTTGNLNLKNTAPFKSLWSSLGGTINFTVSNAAGGELNPNIAYDTNAATTYAKTAPWTGVTATETPVIADGNYFMVIPGNTTNGDQNVELQVVITYAVITADAKLADSYSEVENVITKKVTINKFTNNKAYNLKLILGLTSVKLDAEVADWKVDGSTEVYLPQNAE